jgi:hypothetical protein
MRFKSPEVEQSVKDVAELPAVDHRSKAFKFALAWAELLEKGFELDPMQSFEGYMDENFMLALIEVGNRDEFKDYGPEVYNTATNMVESMWVHGDAFGAWVRRLETPWELIHLGVKTAGEAIEEAQT